MANLVKYFKKQSSTVKILSTICYIAMHILKCVDEMLNVMN